MALEFRHLRPSDLLRCAGLVALLAAVPARGDEPLISAAESGELAAEPTAGSLASLPPDQLTARLQAIAAEPTSDASVTAQLIDCAKRHAGNPVLAREIARALGSCRSRAAANQLVSLLAAARDSESIRTIQSALERSTGKLGIAPDDHAWSAYLRTIPENDAAWQAEVIRNIAAARDAKAAEAAALTTRLTDSLRTLHLATPPEQRWPLLSSMLGDALPPVNLLALDLISRELSANNRPDATIAASVLKLVRSSDDRVREQAAILVANLAPTGAAESLNDALEHETSPRAAAAMLAATSRWPEPAFEPSVIRWLKSDAAASNEARAARDGAIEAAWALYRAGYLRDEDAATPIREVLRNISLGDLSGAGCQLRVEIGDSSDRDAVAVLLGSKIPAQRLAAATSLVGYPEFLPRILAAARVDPLLIDPAVRGVLTQAPGVPGFVAIEEATRNAREQRRAALVVIAAVLEEDEIIEAASRVDDPSLREAVLAQLADPKRIMAERTEPKTLSTVARGLLQLSQLRLELNRPGDAIGALDALPEIESLIPAEQVRNARTQGLLLLGRTDQARETGGSVSAWLEALAFAIQQAPDRAQGIASALETTMADKLEAAERTRLEELKVKLAALAKK